ncbi:MAG TPA: HAD family hydrolase [Micrococcaceae bacterium]|nr:HAD family hydrolase [Micrococcaceae bacterium]
MGADGTSKPGGQPSEPGGSADTAAARQAWTPSSSIHGVLFDIDDTLVDLRTAMGKTIEHVSAGYLPDMTAQQWAEFKRIFWADPDGRYDAYLRGEVSFAEQRIARAALAFGTAGAELDAAEGERWNVSFEEHAHTYWQLFDDVLPALDALDEAGIPYGAISNNVHAYQRTKLDTCGLERIGVLVGTDTVGVPKPAPEIFREGARRLGSHPSATLYVGDNLLVDAVGAADAGLVGVWLNRDARRAQEVLSGHGVEGGYTGIELDSLSALEGLL